MRLSIVLKDAFEIERRTLSIFRAKIACGVILVFHPFFFLLDYLLEAPLRTFAILRAINFLETALLLFLLERTRPQNRRGDFYILALFVSVGLTMSLLCFFWSGYQSPYYVGLNLVIIGLGVLIPWPFSWSLVTTLLIYLSYVIPMSFHENSALKLIITNNYFILATAIIAVTGSYLQYFVRFKEFVGRQDLKDANEKLKELDRAKSNFLATISHELKTPMTLIVNPLEQALTSTKGKKVELNPDDVEAVRRNVYRLSTLVSDLIEISRGEVGKSQLVPSDIHDVKKHFENLFVGMQPLFEEKGIQILFQCEDSPNSHFFDVKKIDKVFYNLLGNALKFTPKGGRVEIHLKDVMEGQKKPTLEISVKDNGIGIPSDKLSKVFERFTQVEEGSTRSYEGMGIGLSLVKDFVEQHGGEVSVTSEVGRGSTFKVLLRRGQEHFRVPAIESQEGTPVSEQRLDFTRSLIKEEATKRTTMELEAQSVRGGKTILVVDDNAEVCETIRKILLPDFQIVIAQNGQEGLERAREARPTLIISDIMMPVMDGYQMTKEIRNDAKLKDTPIILLTAKSGEEGLEAGFTSGANDYLTKPFSPSELKLRVKNHILMQSMKAEIVRQQNLASVGTLSAGISHNMNTYAATVDAGLRLARIQLQEQEQSLAESAKKDILNNLMGAKDGLKSIKNMIEALEIYSQKNVEGFREENLAVTTNAVIDLAKTMTPPNVSIEFDSPSNVPCYFNPHVLNPALMNLIKNAADACKERSEGKISISLSNGSDDTILITVKDNGHGIAPEIRHRIWDAYFTTRDVGSGTGLGLFMVRRDIELEHRGKVWFESDGEGTTFFVSLPKKGGQHGQTSTEKNPVHRG